MSWKQGLFISILILGIMYLAKQKFSKINDITNRLPRHRSKHYSKRDLSVIDKIIVHHSATSDGDPFAFARYHVDTRDWPGIGYHFVIMKNGTIYQTNKLTSVSYHVSGQNYNSIGVVFPGNFDTQYLSKEQNESMEYLVNELEVKLKRKLPITGHNQYAAKSCPGAHVDVAEFDFNFHNSKYV